MNDSKQSQFAANLSQMAQNLSVCEQVRQYDTSEEKEAWTLAHAFLDLTESFRKFSEEQLPKLSAGQMDSNQVNDLLLEIGEDFRHILYHIFDSRYYAYLRNLQQ
jgi:hypothetical protein